MQPCAYYELEKMSLNIYDVCLEKDHLNMVVTKIIGMLARGKIRRIILQVLINHLIVYNYIIL